MDTDPQIADALLHDDFEFVFMGRAQISNTVYTKETFRPIFMEQVFGPLLPTDLKRSKFFMPSAMKKMLL